jgi:hypothetical protein
MWMIGAHDGCIALVWALYGAYLYSGLVLLLLASAPSLALTGAPAWLLANAYLRWDLTIYLLAVGNILHAKTLFGPAFAAKFLVVSSLAIVAIEQYGLATGNVFGHYFFPAEEYGGLEGPRVNGNLPVLVLTLWQALLYPCFLLGLEI